MTNRPIPGASSIISGISAGSPFPCGRRAMPSPYSTLKKHCIDLIFEQTRAEEAPLLNYFSILHSRMFIFSASMLLSNPAAS
jgi:hypothetical protein